MGVRIVLEALTFGPASTAGSPQALPAPSRLLSSCSETVSGGLGRGGGSGGAPEPLQAPPSTLRSIVLPEVEPTPAWSGRSHSRSAGVQGTKGDTTTIATW